MNGEKKEKQRMKKVIAVLLCSVMLTAMVAGVAFAENKYCPFCGHEYSTEKGFAFCPNCGKELPKQSRAEEEQVNSDAVAVGDVVTFGRYEQDNDSSNGKEEVEWVVLAKDGNKALLISKYALDCQQYNSSRVDITWETCSLRSWLNETFMNAAFSDVEQKQIITSKVTADRNPDYSTDPGKDTTDKVFLLSITEANKYFSTDAERQCIPTAYAKAKGCYVNSDKNTCWWWLRSPGYNSYYTSGVLTVGSVGCHGNHVNTGDDAVRPALWINLDS